MTDILKAEPSGSQQRSSPDLLFLFPPDLRPDAEALRKVVASVPDLSISSAPDGGTEPLGFELHRQGMTFDIVGLSPGPGATLPRIRNWLAVAPAERPERMRSLGIALGPHIRAGRADITIFRGLLRLAQGLLEGLPHCLGICWSASGTIIAPADFVEQVRGWDAGGAFPVQMVIAVNESLNGGTQTSGLHYFTGQELRLEPAAAGDDGQASLLALRLASQLIHGGRLDGTETVAAPDGRLLRLVSSPNGRFVRVWPG